MPVKPPQAGQRLYVEKPSKVYGEQYLAGAPLPIGAVAAIDPIYPSAGGPYVSTPTGVYPLHLTDWVLTNRYTGHTTGVLTDADFQEQYGSGAP